MATNMTVLTMAILVFSTLTLAINQNVIKTKPVSIGELIFSKNENLGVVKGVRTCGGSATVIQWRYATCSESDDVCLVPTDGVLRTCQVDFIPSHDIKEPALRLIVKSNDGKVESVFDEGTVIANEGVRKGIPYTVTSIGGVNEELKGKDAVVQYIVYDLSNNEIGFCIETDAFFY